MTVVGSQDELPRWRRGHGQAQRAAPALDRRGGDRLRECGKAVDALPEVGDAWLDAGIVPFSTLGYLRGPPSYWEQWFPADFVTEMREQIRLWFYRCCS